MNPTNEDNSVIKVIISPMDKDIIEWINFCSSKTTASDVLARITSFIKANHNVFGTSIAATKKFRDIYDEYRRGLIQSKTDKNPSYFEFESIKLKIFQELYDISELNEKIDDLHNMRAFLSRSTNYNTLIDDQAKATIFISIGVFNSTFDKFSDMISNQLASRNSTIKKKKEVFLDTDSLGIECKNLKRALRKSKIPCFPFRLRQLIAIFSF